MRALVTGCAGFIGSHLTESLLADGVDVVGVDCFNDNYGRAQKLQNLRHATAWELFEFVPIDLARGDLQELITDCDVVFHLAAEPGVRSSWGARFDTYLRNNLLATQYLLEAMRATPEKRLVYASSSSVYGEAETLPTSETTPTRPFSPYGVTKLAAEQMCQLYRGNYGAEVVILRYFSVYGPRQRPDMGFNVFCRAALANTPVTVFDDGEQTRDFTFVGDVVAATRAAASAAGVTGQVFNIGGGSQVSINHALSLLSTFVGRRLDVQHLRREHGDVRNTAADTRRARESLGFDPQTKLEDGLRAEFAWIAGEGQQRG